jgi:hypothetical protein
LITKAEIVSINGAGNRCIVRMPLFETASSTTPITAEALVSITPGFFNNLNVKDVVFVAFEENAIEKPIIIGKLYKGTGSENLVNGGMGILDTLKVRTAASIPSSTLYVFPQNIRSEYKELQTPKKVADYIKWLEKLMKKLITQLEDHFNCFKNWTQWQLKAENVEVDDGDLDDISRTKTEPFQYQKEGSVCRICGNNCTRPAARRYSKTDRDKEYPNI